MSESLTGTSLKIGILTISDSCSEKRAEDKSGANLRRLIQEGNLVTGVLSERDVVSDDEEKIKNKLTEWCDKKMLNLILTTGGTGFSPRDVTPEATKAVLQKEAIGITIAMITQSLQVTKLAMLSRLVCGSRGQTLIINLPGSVKGSEECFRFAVPGIKHAVDLLRNNTSNVKQVHTELQSTGVHTDAKQHKEKQHLDIATRVLQKYSKQYHTTRKKSKKQKRKYIGIMVRHTVKEKEKLALKFDDDENVTVKSTSPLERETQTTDNTIVKDIPTSPLYIAEKLKSPHGTNFEKEDSLDLPNLGSFLPPIENIPSVDMEEIKCVQSLYCEGIHKHMGHPDLNVDSEDLMNNSFGSNGLQMFDHITNDTGADNQRKSNIHTSDQVIINDPAIQKNGDNQFMVDNMIVHGNRSDDNQLQHQFALNNDNQIVLDAYNFGNENNASDQNHSQGDLIINDGHSTRNNKKQSANQYLDNQVGSNGTVNNKLRSPDHLMIYINNQDGQFQNGNVSINGTENILFVDEMSNEYGAKNGVKQNINIDNNVGRQESVGCQADLSSSNSVVDYIESDDENPVKRDISIYDIDSDMSSDRIILPSSYRKMNSLKLNAVSARPFRSFSSKNEYGLFKKTSNKNDQDLFKKPSCTKVAKNKILIETQRVEVGKGIYKFFTNHPKIRGIYLNKGKRSIKKDLVALKRHESAIDQGSWRRGKFIHDRNRLDDYFIFTNEGQRKKKMLDKKMIRDEYVVNWYLFCPGKGNCKRKCGGYGKCINDCTGMAHKQDRHNCSVMVNMKLFLSDLNHWKIQVTGDHVEDGHLWVLPQEKRINEVTRDQIIATYSSDQPEAPEEGVIKILPFDKDRKRYLKNIASMKRRRKLKTYNARNDNNQNGNSNTGYVKPANRSDKTKENVTSVYTYTTHKVVDTTGQSNHSLDIGLASPQCLSQETIIYAETPSDSEYQYTLS